MDELLSGYSSMISDAMSKKRYGEKQELVGTDLMGNSLGKWQNSCCTLRL